MKLLLLAIVAAVVRAHDGIVWSTNKDVSDFKLSEVDDEQPLAIVLLEQFSLSDFNKFARVYQQAKKNVAERPLLSAIRGAKSYDDFAFHDDVEDVTLDADNVHVFRAEDLTDLDGQLKKMLKDLKSKDYTVALLSVDAIERLEVARRHKRQSGMPLMLAADGDMSPVNSSDCAMAIDQVMITVHMKGADDATYCLYPTNVNMSENVANYQRQCNVQSSCTTCDGSAAATTVYKSIFTLTFDNGQLCDPFPKDQGITINSVTLQFAYESIINNQWWRLGEVKVLAMDYDGGDSGFTFPTPIPGALDGVTAAYITTIYYNSWQCPMTEQIHANQGKNTDSVVAFQFKNFVAQPFGWMDAGNANGTNITLPYLTPMNAANPRQMDTCVPVFSIADYMTYLIIGIMLIFFFFILGLLNDLKTNDRYDDVKQKPLVITVKGE